MSRLALLLFAACPLAPAAAQQTDLGPAPALDEKATLDVVRSFQAASDWSMQALALLTLGTDWHPAGSAIVLAALQAKDARLHAFGIEQLRRTDQRVFASVCLPPVIAELVEHHLSAKTELVRTRALAVLQRLLPAAGSDRESVQRWWNEHAAGYAAPAWTAPTPVPRDDHTVALPLVQRAFDLREAGLQVVIVIDSTLSMQPAINAARDAVNDFTAMLSAIVPRFELGLVHYKDVCDWPQGAKILAPLTRDQGTVRRLLAELVAGGGGDFPEKVDAGIALALGKEMKWNREANHLIVVIGDAPPHKKDLDGLLALVERAHRHPFEDPKQPAPSAKLPAARPFVVSAIATSTDARPSFEQIAKAGGGTCVDLIIPGDAGLPGKPASSVAPPDAAEGLAGHVLWLAFGAQYEAQLRPFVATFFCYHRAGAF